MKRSFKWGANVSYRPKAAVITMENMNLTQIPGGGCDARSLAEVVHLARTLAENVSPDR